MKIDKYIKAVARRLDNVIANGNGNSGDGNGNGHGHGHSYNGDDDGDELIIKDDEYYISLGIGGLQAEAAPLLVCFYDIS